MLLLVRPAHAGDKQRWPGSDEVIGRVLDRPDRHVAVGRHPPPPLPLADVLIPPSVPHGAHAKVLRQASQRGRRDGATLLSTIR